MVFFRIQIPTDRTSGTPTRATQMLTLKFVEICLTPLTTAPRLPGMWYIMSQSRAERTIALYI